MKTITIEATRRERTGKGGARTARREGSIPCVLYGQGESVPLSVDRRDFARKFQDAAGENVIWDVAIAGEEPRKSLAREIQHHPISRRMTHVDFQHIDLSRRIQVAVVVNLVGEPDGVRNYGGILEHAGREVMVECLPINIPASIEVDVTNLAVGDSIHLSDLPAVDFELLEDPHKVIAHVAAPTVETVDEAEGEEGAAEGAEAAGDDEKKEEG
ncbi:50S ribosomal protein L25, partial [bacterium]|nr:50S ribosomal protein L25 [bacterium]